MELCGENLRNWLNLQHNAAELHINIRQTRIIQGMISGLKYLHQNKIIHRDLKPENIMFSKGKYHLPVKIGGFGFSRKNNFEETETGSLTPDVGTRTYMAPEVHSGIYGQQADLYSLGLIFWEVSQLMGISNIRNFFDKLVYDKEEELVKDHPIMRGIKEIIIGLTKPETSERTKTLNDIDIDIWDMELFKEVQNDICTPLWEAISNSEKNLTVKTSQELKLCLDNAQPGCIINLDDGEYLGPFVVLEDGVQIVGNGAGTVLLSEDSNFFGAATTSRFRNLALSKINREYPTTGRKKALIINVPRKRYGAEGDNFALRGTLERCGFAVQLCQSFTKSGIFHTVALFKEDLKDVCCIIVAVMSHETSADKFLTEDDCELHLKKDIVHAFNNANCPELINMPKIFLANFCRDDRNSVPFCHRMGTFTDWRHPVPEWKTETDSKTSYAEDDATTAFSDILIVHGTYDEHNYHYHITKKGTCFIQSLCEILRTHADGRHDFIDIINRVFKKANEKAIGGYESTGFCKKLFLSFKFPDAPLFECISNAGIQYWTPKTSPELEFCLDNAQPGCIINLEDGEYIGSFVLKQDYAQIIGTGSGTVLQSDRIDCLLISGSGCTISNIKIIRSGIGIIINGSKNTIKHVKFADMKVGMMINRSQTIVDNVTMTNLEKRGIDISSNENTISNITGLDLKMGILVFGSHNKLANIKFQRIRRDDSSLIGVELYRGASDNMISHLTCTGYFIDKVDWGLRLWEGSSNCTVRDSVCGPVWTEGNNLTLTNVDCGEYIIVGERGKVPEMINCHGKVKHDPKTVKDEKTVVASGVSTTGNLATRIRLVDIVRMLSDNEQVVENVHVLYKRFPKVKLADGMYHGKPQDIINQVLSTWRGQHRETEANVGKLVEILEMDVGGETFISAAEDIKKVARMDAPIDI